MFLAHVIDAEENRDYGQVYMTLGGLLADTFNEDLQIRNIIDLHQPKGKTREERKEDLRFMAIEYSGGDYPDLSCEEYLLVTSWFNHYAHEYGLVEEFEENGII